MVDFPEEQPIYGDEGALELRLLPDSLAEVADRPLPIAVSRSFADATRAEVGDSVAIGSLTRRTQVGIAAIVDAFPTLEPNRPFVVARRRRLRAVHLWPQRRGPVRRRVVAVGRRMRQRRPPAGRRPILGRDARRPHERAAELTDDPVALGVIGALAIGSISALIVAVIGFVVSAAVSTRERLGEFALLHALGLSPAAAVGVAHPRERLSAHCRGGCGDRARAGPVVARVAVRDPDRGCADRRAAGPGRDTVGGHGVVYLWRPLRCW